MGCIGKKRGFQCSYSPPQFALSILPVSRKVQARSTGLAALSELFLFRLFLATPYFDHLPNQANFSIPEWPDESRCLLGKVEGKCNPMQRRTKATIFCHRSNPGIMKYAPNLAIRSEYFTQLRFNST
jgi:hypothetical protein